MISCVTQKQLVKLAKRLRKEKVNVDVVSFGEDVSILFILLLVKIQSLENYWVGTCKLCN